VATAQSHAVLTVTALMEPATASLVFMVMTAAKVSAHCTSVFIHLAATSGITFSHPVITVSGEGLRWNVLVVLSHGGYNI
jgi:hypothetical protein